MKSRDKVPLNETDISKCLPSQGSLLLLPFFQSFDVYTCFKEMHAILQSLWYMEQTISNRDHILFCLLKLASPSMPPLLANIGKDSTYHTRKRMTQTRSWEQSVLYALRYLQKILFFCHIPQAFFNLVLCNVSSYVLSFRTHTNPTIKTNPKQMVIGLLSLF